MRGFLIVDEAHSLGACAPRGGAVYGKVCNADITVGTFGKAFGSLGGFILCSTDMQTYLINRSRSFIFTTALPEVYAAVGIDAIDLVETMDDEREKLRGLSEYLVQGLASAGFRISGDAHIIALYCIGAEEAVELSRLLYERGIALYAVRPPTVPPSEILLRISLNATLEKSDLDFFLEQLGSIKMESPQLFERLD
jgi:8-amino-7-oxononanoate synthase